MRRIDVPEIEDQRWCPRFLRDFATEWLCALAETSGAFHCVVPKIEAAMLAVSRRHIIDLCSGGGGPWPSLVKPLLARGRVTVELTDLFPNAKAFITATQRGYGHVSTHCESIDALNVPESFLGVRTMFNCFHHFSPELARRVLSDAVAKGNAICIFEVCTHRAVGFLLVCLQIPALMLLTPVLLPRSPLRWFLTYGVPLVPALVAFDGFASMLRLYSESELRQMAATFPTYNWDIGSTRIPGTPFCVRHFVGVPFKGRTTYSVSDDTSVNDFEVF